MSIMKNMRQVAILEIISRQNIETQEELANALQQRGIRATQATVSRDIKELRLAKVMTTAGVSKYAAPEKGEMSVTDRFIRILSDSLQSAEYAGSMVVIKTLSGSAGVAAEALDSLEWPEALGTIAGDNTIFMVARGEKEAADITERIRELMK